MLPTLPWGPFDGARSREGTKAQACRAEAAATPAAGMAVVTMSGADGAVDFATLPASSSACPAGRESLVSEHLAHGWEPELPAEDSLVRCYVCAMTDVSAFMTRAVDGRIARWDDVYVADPASPVPFDNLAVLLQPSTLCDIDDVGSRLLDFYRASGTSRSSPPGRSQTSATGWS